MEATLGAVAKKASHGSRSNQGSSGGETGGAPLTLSGKPTLCLPHTQAGVACGDSPPRVCSPRLGRSHVGSSWFGACDVQALSKKAYHTCSGPPGSQLVLVS